MACGHGGTLAVELGSELMRVALVDVDGRALRQHREPTPRHTDCPGAVTMLVRGLGEIGAAAGSLAHTPHLPGSWAPWVSVVGGGIDRTGDLLLEPLRAGLRRHGPAPLPVHTQVQGGALGGDACLIGAAAWHEAFDPEAAGRREAPEPGRRESEADLGGTVCQWPTRPAAEA